MGQGLLRESAKAGIRLDQGREVSESGKGMRNERQTVKALAQAHGGRRTRLPVCDESLEVGQEGAQAAPGCGPNPGEDSAFAFAGSIVGKREYRGGLAEVYIIFLFGRFIFFGPVKLT
jgi:hypothetical protein